MDHLLQHDADVESDGSEPGVQVTQYDPGQASGASHPRVNSAYFSARAAGVHSMAGKRPRDDGVDAEARSGEYDSEDDFMGPRAGRAEKRSRPSLSLVSAQSPGTSPSMGFVGSSIPNFIEMMYRKATAAAAGDGSKMLPDTTVQILEITMRPGGLAGSSKLRMVLSDGKKSHSAVVSGEQSSRLAPELTVGDVVKLEAHKVNRHKSGITWIIDALSVCAKGSHALRRCAAARRARRSAQGCVCVGVWLVSCVWLRLRVAGVPICGGVVPIVSPSHLSAGSPPKSQA